MTDRTFDDTAASAALRGASRALTSFASDSVSDAGRSIENTMTRSFSAVSNTIESAARAGKLSIASLAQSVIADFDRIAARQFIAKPIENIIGSIAGAILPIAGARASGGPVAAGEAYLVGEQGPEIFVPGQAGGIVPNNAAASPRVTVHINTPDASSFFKSQSQVAALMSRALARGQRNM